VAALDDRVAAAAPAIGIQNWGWALANDAWRARLESIPALGPAAAADMSRPGGAPDAAVAEEAWRRLLPGACRRCEREPRAAAPPSPPPPQRPVRHAAPALLRPTPTRPACPLAPQGLLDHYDTPASLACIAPRPLLILNGEHDPRCPLPGVAAAAGAAASAYAAAGAPPGALELRVFGGVGHEFTPAMAGAAAEFFDEWL
jgi:hypothetical protein